MKNGKEKSNARAKPEAIYLSPNPSPKGRGAVLPLWGS